MKNDNTTFYLTLVAFGFLGLILYLSLKEKTQPKTLGLGEAPSDFVTKEEALKILTANKKKAPESEYAVELTGYSPY